MKSGRKIKVLFSSLPVTLCKPQPTPNMAQYGCGLLTNRSGQGGFLKEVMLNQRLRMSLS